MGLGDLSDIVPMQKPVSNQLPYNLIWRMIEDEILPECIRSEIGVLVYSPLMHGILADKYNAAVDVPEGRARTRHFSRERSQTRHDEAGCESETFAALDRIRGLASAWERSMPQIALSWVIQQRGIVSVIAGARNSEQLRNNVAFMEDPLSDEQLSQLDEATVELKRALGTNPDMWDSGRNARFC